jgi:hypothetical protein
VNTKLKERLNELQVDIGKCRFHLGEMVTFFAQAHSLVNKTTAEKIDYGNAAYNLRLMLTEAKDLNECSFELAKSIDQYVKQLAEELGKLESEE